MELESKALRLAIADAIVQKLWFKGLINDTERDRMKEKNKLKILSLDSLNFEFSCGGD